MATKLFKIQTDINKSHNGVSIQYPGTDFHVGIRRGDNPRFEEAVRDLRMESQGKKLLTGELNSREALNIMAPAVARHIIVDWKNLADNDGNPIPYSPQKAMEILQDPESTDLYLWVMKQANDPSNFRKQQAEAEAQGN